MKRFHLFLFAVVVIGLFSCPVFAATITFTINAGTTPTPIPPQTYGSDQTLTGVVNPLYRQGGNRMTAYNWENNASNAGTDYGPNHEDWYMVPGGVTPPGMPATTLADFILGNNALGVDSLVTLQMAGYVSADGNCNCDVTITGAADTAGTYWKTVVFNGGPTTGLPNTSDNVVYMNEEIAYLLSTVGGAGTGGAKFYDLDNEPALWNSTHPLVHPSQPSCAEVSGKGITLAQVITGADPNAQILGPVAYGWSEYVNNQSAPDSPTGLSPSYGVTYLCYYLQQFNNASTTAGHRLLHYLDLHWYPEATGSNGASQVRITNDDTSYGVDVARMQAPRSLWDPGYTESSWITWGTGGPITLISRLQAAVSQYYPGTGLSFSEYQYGAGEDISGGVAQADALGVLGKYGVIACRWDDGTSDIYVNAAFNLYLNYDGAGSKFGNLSMPVSSSSVTLGSAYASRNNSLPTKMWVVAVNRDYPSPGTAVTDTANFTVNNLAAGQSIIGIRAFRFDPGSSTLHSVSPAPVTTSANSFTDSGMPGRSGTIYELTLSQSFIATYTPTPSNTPTSTPTPTASKTPTSADTSTPTSTVTSTATLSPTLTPTPTGTWYTPTPTNSPTLTSSDTSTATPSFTRTSTPSSTPTSTATFTPTSTRTSTASPSATFTPTLTPTITNTFTWTPTPSTAGVLFPNPLFSWTPVKFFYNLTAPADQVKVKIFTVSFRKIYEDDSLPTSAGQDKGTLDFGQTGLNIANGLYYVVVYFKSGGSENHQVMKLLVQR